MQDFLRRSIVDRPYVYVDNWSAVHLFSGAAIGLAMAAYFPRKLSWLYALALLAVYELFEVLLTGIMFATETWADRIWDYIIGMAGFSMAYIASRKAIISRHS